MIVFLRSSLSAHSVLLKPSGRPLPLPLPLPLPPEVAPALFAGGSSAAVRGLLNFLGAMGGDFRGKRRELRDMEKEKWREAKHWVRSGGAG